MPPLAPLRSRPRPAFAATALALALATSACGGDESGAPATTETTATSTPDATSTPPTDTTAPVDTAGQVCPPNRLFCVSPRESGQCTADGSGIASTTPCVGATACEPSTGLCRATICEPDATSCLDFSHEQKCASDGSGWGPATACAEPLFCADGKCRACTDSEVDCLSETTYRRCAEDGSTWSQELLCPSDYRCVPDGGDNGDGDCKRCGFERVCVSDTKVRTRCTSGEIDYQQDTICAAGTTCMEGFCRACEPKASECLSETTFRQCKDDGSAWSPVTDCPPDEACLGDKCLPYGCSPRVLLLVDYSGSMSGSKWDEVAASVAALVSQNPDVRFGMKTFPDEASSFGCDVSATLEIPFATGQAQVFADWFAAHDPPGSTPLAAALAMVNDNAADIFGPLGGYVIMLSDGEDSCYYSQDPAIRPFLALTAASLFVDHKVATYGVAYGFGGGEAGEMDTVAKNGGTGQSEAIDAGNEAELTKAFSDIIDKVKFCDQAPGGTP